MRLIDANALIWNFGEVDDNGAKRWDFFVTADEMREVSTVDAVPVRHGRWVWNDYGGFGNYHCSECRKICTCNGDYDYCPNCGARMDTDETD